jgi:aspartyl protease family protein
VNGDDIARLIAGLLMLTLVGSSLINRRVRLGLFARYALAWVGIFALFTLAFSFRTEAEAVWSRVVASFSPEQPRVSGRYVRIDRGEDGHFSVVASVNGKSMTLLIDTGATTTTLSRALAQSAGVEIDSTGFGVIVNTANGNTTMRRARARSITIGPIMRENQPLLISEDDELNVLGMSFLSSLGSWRVDGKTMVLVP